MKRKISLSIFILLLLFSVSCKRAESIPTAEAATPASAARISFEVESVSLNYQTNRMEIRGKLTNKGSDWPSKIWVWAYFVNPTFGSRSSMSDQPIEIDRTGPNDNPIIIAVGPFHWWDNPEVPKDNYYARVRVSAVSADDARLHSSLRDYKTENLFRVQIIK